MARTLGVSILAVLVYLVAGSAAQAQVPTITTYAGGGLPTAGPATATGVGVVGGIGRDPSGNLYFSSGTGTILKMDTSGNLSVFAGNGTCCFSGDGGLATSAQTSISTFLDSPVKTDPAGNVYYVDFGACVVREINASTGIITTVAGSPSIQLGSCSYAGDGGPALDAQISPNGLGFDSTGNLYISDYTGCAVRRVDHSTHIITTVAGNGTCGFSGDTNPATSAQLNSPSALVLDPSGNLYIADSNNGRVRLVNASTQAITTYAGGGATLPPTATTTATQAQLFFPTGLAFDLSGNLLIADSAIPAVFRVSSSNQIISIIAGNLSGISAGSFPFGFAGDGGPATSALLDPEYGVEMDLAVDTAGNIFVTDNDNFRVRKIDTMGNISTVAGNGAVGDGGSATSALLFGHPGGLDSTGSLIVNDEANSRIRRINSSSLQMSTVAGMDVGPAQPPSGNGGSATSAQLFIPLRVTMDPAHDLYILDNVGTLVRKVTSGTINAFAGTGSASGPVGDGGPATSARLSRARGLAVDSGGNLYIGDTGHNEVRVVNSSSLIINSYAGSSALGAGYSGDGGPATAAQLNAPRGLAFDSKGNLYIADANNGVIREVNASTQTISTVAGNFNNSGGMGGDGGPAAAASLNFPSAVAFDAFGNLYIADQNNYRVRVVNSVTGIISTLAGNGLQNFGGDGGPAASAGLSPNSLFVTAGSGGNILVYAGDEISGRVRLITIPPVPAAYLTPAAGLGFTSQQTGTTSAAQFVTIANSGTGPLNVSGVSFTGTDPSDFVVTAGGSCTSTPFALAPTASCTLAVAFMPTGTGMRMANLSVADDAAGSPQTLMLAGSGSPAAPPNPPSALTASVGAHTVGLNWTASSTTGVTYNVYRMLQSGGACSAPTTITYTLIASAIGATSYMDADPNLMVGSTYCYAVTAVAGGVESTFSNVAMAPLTSGFVSTLSITMATLPSGAVNVPYGADIQFSGGQGPYTFTVTSGLPALSAAGFSVTTTGSGNVSPGHVYSTTTPPATMATYTFGVTVTDSSSPTPQTAMATISFTIGAAPANTQASLLKGQYALRIGVFSDSGGDEQGIVGSLNFDGVGNCTGVLDFNNISGITQNAAATCTYSIGPDNRGFLTLTVASGSATFALAVGTVYRGAAYDVKLTQFNDNDGNHHIGSGFLKLQDPTAFNPTIFACGQPFGGTCQGTYAFGLTGQDTALARAAEVGVATFDNALNLTSGGADINEAGAATSITFSGTYTAPDTNGRTVISATVMPSGAFTSVLYIISANEAVVMTLDPRASNDLFIGSALRQASPGTFTNSSVAGPDIFYFTSLSSGGGGSETVAGQATASGSTLTINYDDNSQGKLSLNQSIGFTYSVAANGRLLATSANAALICYLASPDRGFCMLPDSSVGSGELRPQVGGPFSNASLTGNATIGQQETVHAHEAISGIANLVSPGSASFNLTFDQSHAGGRLGFGQTGATINFTIMGNGHFSGSGNLIGNSTGYLISPYELVLFDTTGPPSDPTPSMNPSLLDVKSITAPPGTPSPASTSVNFPTPIAQGSAAAISGFIFTNTGLGPMTITGVNTSASPDFNAQGAGAGGCFNPSVGALVLRPGESCTITFTFNPTMSTPIGVVNETLVLTTDGTTNVTVAVSGTATGSGCTKTWTGGAGDGQWTSATNWSPSGVPASTDNVCIGAVNVTLASGTQTISSISDGGTLTISGGSLSIAAASPASSIQNLTLSGVGAGGTLTGTGMVTIPGTLVWSAGTISGAETVTVSGPISIMTNNVLLDTATLNANSTTTLSTGCLSMANGAVLNIGASGLFDIQNSCNLAGSGTINNAGILQQSTGAGPAFIQVTLVNTGTVQATAGTLVLNGGSTSTGNYKTTAAGATLQFGGPTAFNLSGALSGIGTFNFAGGTQNLTGTYTVTTATGTTSVSGATVNMTAPLAITSLGALNLSAGTLNLSSATAMVSTPSLTFSATGSATLAGSNNLTVNGPTSWTGGGSGSLTGTGTTTLNGPITINNGIAAISAGNVIAKGNTTISGAGGMSITGPGTWTNSSGFLFDIQNNSGISAGSPAGTFINQGTLQRSTSATLAAIGAALNNTGLVNVLSGTLSLSGGGTCAPSPNCTGSITMANNTTLTFGTGTYNLGGSLTGTGTTTVTVNNGSTVNFAAPAAGITTLTDNGVVTIASGINLGIGTVTVSGGGTSSLSGFGSITGNVSVTNGNIHAGGSPGTLTINGNFTIGGGGILNADLGGTTPGSGYSQLVVNGTATLAGALNVTNFGMFSAAAGNTFTLILPTAVSGTFATTVFPPPPPGAPFSLSYAAAPAGVVLMAGAPITVTGVAFNPATVTGGTGSTGTVTLSAAAPAGGTTVSLSSGNPAVATVPMTVSVSAGNMSQTFTATTAAVATQTPVTVTATLGASSVMGTLTVNPPVVTVLSFNPSTVVSGQMTTGSVTLSGPAPAGGFSVGLSCSNMAALPVPMNVVVPAGTNSQTFAVTAGSVATSTPVMCTATTGTTMVTSNVTVVPVTTVTSLMFASPAVTGGTSSTGTVTINQPAAAGGITVSLASGDPSVTVPASVVVALGNTTQTFTATTVGVATVKSVTVTATLGASNIMGTLTVNPAAIISVAFNPVAVTAGTNSTGTVTLSGPAPPAGLTATLMSSNPGAAAVAANFSFAGGATTGTFTVNTFPVAANASVNITVTLPSGNALAGTLTVDAAIAGLSSNNVNFNNQPVGVASAAQMVTLNNTGSGSLNISTVVLSGPNMADFSTAAGTTCTNGAAVAPGSSCVFMLTFKPSMVVLESATVTITDNALPTTQTITLSGTGTMPTASLSATAISFNNQNLGTTSGTMSVTVTNMGNGTLSITGFNLAGNNPGDFSTAGSTCTNGAMVAPTAACTVAVAFSPKALGARSATITLTDNATPPTQTINLTGTGVAPAVTLMPTGLTFGVVPVGMSSTMNVMLTNSGTATLMFNNLSFTGPNAGDFSLAAGTTCQADGGQVTAGNSCTIAVTFTPSAIQPESATLNIFDNAAGSPQMVPLAGGGPGFTLTVPPSSSGGNGSTVTVLPGDTATYTLMLVCSPGVTGTISLMGMQPLPPNTILTITPAMITCPSTGPVTVVVKLQTNCTAAWMAPPAGGTRPGGAPRSTPLGGLPQLLGALLLLALGGLLVLPQVAAPAGSRLAALGRVRVARLAPALVLLVALVLPLCLAGCAVNNLPPALPNQPTTPAGTYPLVIVGTGPSGAKLMLTLTIKVI